MILKEKKLDTTIDLLKGEAIAMLREELPILRAKAKISQEELAQKIGVSRQTYSSIETGKRDMTWTTFMALIAFFQNCDSTKDMYKYIDGIEEKMNVILEKA